MTKKLFSLSIGLVLLVSMAAVALAISGTPGVEMGKKADIFVAPGTRIGDKTLQGEMYQVWCDHKNGGGHEMVLRRMRGAYGVYGYGGYYGSLPQPTNDVIRLKCHWGILPEKARRTEVQTVQREGERLITKILIRGENVEHVFE